MTEIYNKIIKTLKENNIDYKEYHHEPVRTSEEAAKVRQTPLHEGAKALILIADWKNPLMAVVPGDQRVDTELMKQKFSFTKLKMSSIEEAQQISGTEVGGVPPFGNLFEPAIPVYVWNTLLKNEFINFNAGDKSISIKMKSADWQNLVNPIIINND